ncbi:MAG: hypothetical protein ACK5XZ_04300 [Hyphomonadaceae bacterium]|jgi:hypothetical protein
MSRALKHGLYVCGASGKGLLSEKTIDRIFALFVEQLTCIAPTFEALR